MSNSISTIRQIVNSPIAQPVMQMLGISPHLMTDLLKMLQVLEVGVDIQQYLKNYSKYYVKLDFECDVKYFGGFEFTPPYSINNLAHIPSNIHFVYGEGFRALASGYLQGIGVFILPNRGRRFECAFRKGYLAENKSVCIWPDGGFYIGEVNRKSAPNGYGEYIYPSGRVYKGEWESNYPTDKDEIKIFDPAYYRHLYG